MGIPRLFKTPRHQKFQYNPMYFDPQKEEIDRKKRTYGESEDNAAILKSRIADGFRSKSRVPVGSEYQSSVRRAGYLRLLVMLILIVMCLLFIQTYLPSLSKWLN